MDLSGRIYMEKAESEAASAEDRARLDGYLRARAEVDERTALDAEVEELREKVKSYEQRLADASKVRVSSGSSPDVADAKEET